MSYHYVKKPEPISTEEKLKLLSMYAWGVDEIQNYWCLRRRVAVDLRNKIKAASGTVAFSKTKVLVSEVMSRMDTSVEEQIKTLSFIKMPLSKSVDLK